MRPMTGPLALTIPAKSLALAKSRLGMPAETRRTIALHLLEHTVHAALACASVGDLTVVTADAEIAVRARALGAVVIDEGTAGDLNRALRLGRERARSLPGIQAIGYLMADLPLVTDRDITAVFDDYRDAGAPVMVRDATGTGTTMLVHARDRCPPLRFGHRSASAHRQAGYIVVADHVSAIRADMDTQEDALTLLPRAYTAIPDISLYELTH